MGDMGTASRWLERSLRLGQKLGLQREVLMTIRVSGEVHRLAGEWETAYALLTQALADSTRLDQYEAGLAHMSLAELFVAASHPKGTESFLTLDEACDHLRQAVAIFEALPAKRELAKARLMAASVELPSRHAGQ